MTPPTPNTETQGLVEELRARATWRNDRNECVVSPSRLLLVADALTSKEEEIERLKASQHHFKDEDWPLALQRLKHMEPGQDQGLAVVGTDDLEFALERLAHFAQVAMGNAAAVSVAEAHLLRLRGALEPFSRVNFAEHRDAHPWAWFKAAREALSSLGDIGGDRGASRDLSTDTCAAPVASDVAGQQLKGTEQ